MRLKEFSLPLLRRVASTNTFPLNHLYRKGSAFRTGTLGPAVERKTLLRNKLWGSGISLLCKRHLSMSNMKFFMNDFFSTRTPSTLTSASNRSTFMTRDEVRKIILLKENRDGFYKAFFHVPLFVELQPVVRRSLLYYRCTSAISLPRKKGIAKKIIQTLRAIMISQDVDLVASDFKGTAWRCRSREYYR